MTARIPLRVGLPAVAIGGALGAVGRQLLLNAAPVHGGQFPWTVFTINVAGAALLALLPALALVRRVTWLPLFLGTGVLGGFTTMSSAAVETVQLRGHTLIASSYLFGTLAAALLAVLVVDRLSTPAERALIEAEEGDE